MTVRFKQIVEQLNALVTFKADRSMSDDDFIANVEAINLLCNTYDDLGLDRKEIRRKMSALYPDFSRRINERQDIQFAIPLIMALHDFIFGRENDHGSKRWRDTLTEMCCRVVESYRENPIIDSTEYLFALDIVSRLSDDNDNPDIKDYQEAISALLEDIDDVPLAEKIRRVKAYERARLLFIPDNWEKWAEIRAIVSNEKPAGLDDETFLLWREITDVAPMKELKKRAGNSRRMMMEYLQGCIFTEFARECRLKAKRKLARDLKTLNDDLIGDIIPIKITADMSVATLYALEIIFYLRLQLAQVGWEDKESIYEELCIDRFGQIAKALKRKYKTAEYLNEKIEILERLSAIGQLIHSDDVGFAIEEADKLRQIPGLTYSQRLRLGWIPNIETEKEAQIVTELLNSPSIPTSSLLIPNLDDAVFDMATIAIISDYVTTKNRDSIFNRFAELVNAAVASNDAKALSSLLALAAYWNSCPRFREKIKDLTARLQLTNSSLLIPNSVARLNSIAAEIYSRIDKITGKYDILSA